MHRQMSDMMKKVGKMGKKGMMRQLGGMFGGKGGMPGGGMPSQAEMEAAQKQMGAMPGGGLPGLGGGAALPPGLSGFGKKK